MSECFLYCSFLLKERNRKFKTAKYFLRIALTSLMELNSSPENNSSVMVSGYLEQQFHFNASFAYSFDENLLRSGEKSYEDRKKDLRKVERGVGVRHSRRPKRAT